MYKWFKIIGLIFLNSGSIKVKLQIFLMCENSKNGPICHDAYRKTENSDHNLKALEVLKKLSYLD